MANLNTLMGAQMGMSVISGLTTFAVGREQAKMDAAVQAYNNQMARLSAGQSRNAVSISEIQTQDASLRQSVQIQQQAMQAEGSAKVAAGAAGVAGASVDGVMRGLRSSAAHAQYARLTQTEMQMRSFGHERRGIAINEALGQDVSPVSKPSLGAAMLGIGTNLLEIMDSYQTPGDTLSARLGR